MAKNIEEQGIVKGSKPYRLSFGKKLLLALMAIGMILGGAAGLSACVKDTPPVIVAPAVNTVYELLNEKNIESTKDFLNEQVLAKAISSATGSYDASKLVSSSFDLGDTNASSLGSVKVVYVYKNGEERLFNVANVSFGDGISLGLIADYENSKDEIAGIVSSANVSTEFESTYNAAEKSQNDELAEAIYSNVIKSSEQAEILNLDYIKDLNYTIGGSLRPSVCSSYQLTVKTNTGITSYDLLLKKQSSVEELINSLSNSKNYEITNTTVKTTIQTPVAGKTYEKEKVEQEVVETIDNVQELFDNYSNQANSFFANQTKTFIEKTVGEYNSNNIKGVRWSVGDNSDTSIESAVLEFTVADPTVEGNETFYRINVNYASPVALETIAKGDAGEIAEVISGIECSEQIKFEYNAKDQYFNNSVVNALIQVSGCQVGENDQVMVDFGTSENGYTTYKLGIATSQGYVEYTITAEDGDVSNILNGVVTEKAYANSENTITEVAYQESEYQVSDLETALEYFSEQIDANLENVYKRVMFQALGNSFMDEMNNVSEYKWDLGNVDSYGNIQSLKLAFTHVGNENDNTYYVYNVNFNNPTSINDLLTKTFTTSDFALTKDYYIYDYITTTQGDLNNFIDAVAKAELNDGFDYNLEGTLKLYKQTYAGVNDFNYLISIINDNGVREFQVQLNNKLTTDEQLKQAIEEGNYKLLLENSVDFSANQINVDRSLTNEMENQ